ncbi:hypothetical protein cypCar_00037740, partial [Cyprinus carpio]
MVRSSSCYSGCMIRSLGMKKFVLEIQGPLRLFFHPMRCFPVLSVTWTPCTRGTSCWKNPASRSCILCKPMQPAQLRN